MKVGVIVPVYNGEKFLRETLISLYNQSYNDYVVSFVNDGSSDATEEIILEFKRDIDFYTYQENKGVYRLAETLNVGLSFLGSCDLVTMLPADDLWPIHRLARQVPYFVNDDDLVLVHGRMCLIDSEGTRIKESRRPPRNFHARYNLPIGSALSYLFVENFIQQPTVLIRKASLDVIGGYLQPEDNPAEDFPTQLELLKLGSTIYLDDDVYAFYRQHSGQMTKNHFRRMVVADNKFIKDFFLREVANPSIRIEMTHVKLQKILLSRLSTVDYMEGKSAVLSGDMISGRKMLKVFLKSKYGRSRLKIKAFFFLLKSIV